MLGGAAPASAADQPKPLSSRRLFDQTRPSVQLITVQYSAGLVVPEPVVTQQSRLSLESIVAGRIQRGEVPATRAAAQGAIVDEIARNPSRWLTASSNVSRTNIKLTMTGSGFSISPDGYIVTNAHVVAPKLDDLKEAFLFESIRKEAGDPVAAVGDGLTQSQATKLVNAMVRWATTHATLADFKKKIAVYGSSGSGSTSASKSRTAKLVDSGQQFPGKDVAVIKVRARNMATVPIGDDTTLNAGDRLYVLGFPGPATFDPVLSKDSQKEPTLTQGVLSAKKQVKGGFTILQTDAGMTHGNSGGPVLDEEGRVVGVATVGSVDPNTGREVAGLNFAVPASIVKDLLGHAKVTATEGQATRMYREALDAFDKQWYKPTLPLFEQVKALDPGHPLVARLLNESRTAIREGRDRTPLEILGLPVLVFGSLAAIVVVGIAGGGTGLLVSRRRRRRRRSRPDPTGPGAGWGSQPGGWDTQPAQAWDAQPAQAWDPQPAQAWDAQPAQAWDPQPAQEWDPQPVQAWDGTTDQPAVSESWWAADGSRTQEIPVAGRAVPEPTPWNGAEQAPPAQPQWRPEAGEAAPPVAGEWSQPAQAPAREPEWAQPVRPLRQQARRERDWSEPARPAVSTGTGRAEPERSGASGQPHERYVQAQSASRVCWSCGRHNQPSLRYCEGCWSVLN